VAAENTWPLNTLIRKEGRQGKVRSMIGNVMAESEKDNVVSVADDHDSCVVFTNFLEMRSTHTQIYTQIYTHTIVLISNSL
jgi:formaldehyde-activating enzyme involved in methanogenesis